MSSHTKIILSEVEKQHLKDTFTEIQYDIAGSSNYISRIRSRAYQAIPSRIIDLLEEQKSSQCPLPYIIFDNLPLDENIYGSPNFHQTGKECKSGTLTENILCAFGTIIGEPYSIHFEGRELVNNLTPQKDTQHEYTGLGSEVELDFHIENAALNYMGEDDCSPMALLFLGVRYDDKGPKTYVADARKALAFLSEEDINVLYGENFIIRLPYRWRNAFKDGNENTGLCPMISGPLSLPRLSTVFYPDMVLPVNPRARIAFDNLYQAIKKVAIGIDILPGRLVFVDNRFALHSREKFSPSYDENGLPYRWVQRLFLTNNLWSFRAFSRLGDRVFDPRRAPEIIDNSISHSIANC
jgi:L-asparagine oxygenase